MFYTYGDSHARHTFAHKGEKFRLNEKYVLEPITIGPVTMNKVGRDPFNCSIESNQKTFVLFVFGEIDVRAHINKQCQSRQEDEVIETLAEKYVSSITTQRPKYREIAIMSVVPPVSSKYVKNNTEIPFTGTDEDRARYCKKLNAALENYCKLSNVKFFSVYDEYVDSHGMLPGALSNNTHHIAVHDKSREKLLKFLSDNKLL